MLVSEDVLQVKDQEQQDSKRISLILTYIRFLSKLTAVVRKKNYPNQQKSTRIIPETLNHSLQEKQKPKNNSRKYTHQKWQS